MRNPKQMIDSPRAILDLFPSDKFVAEKTGVAPVAVQRWHERNSIPARYAGTLYTSLRAVGAIGAEEFIYALSSVGHASSVQSEVSCPANQNGATPATRQATKTCQGAE